MRPFDDDETYQQSNKEGINLLLSSSEKIAYFDDLEGIDSQFKKLT